MQCRGRVSRHFASLLLPREGCGACTTSTSNLWIVALPVGCCILFGGIEEADSAAGIQCTATVNGLYYDFSNDVG